MFADLLGRLMRPLVRRFGCQRGYWRGGTCWRHGLRRGSSSGCKRAGWKAAGGRAERRAKGRQEGEATLLLRLLERRFGALPAPVRDRIADTATLEAWGLRVLDAGSLDEVLA